MRYFCNFKNGLVDCYWKREDDQNHPAYIPKADIKEITLEQFDLNHFLILNNGVVEFNNTTYPAYLLRLQRKAKKDANNAKLKALKNADLVPFTLPEVKKIVKAILDTLVDRDELTDEDL